jgi:hypothetical protein
MELVDDALRVTLSRQKRLARGISMSRLWLVVVTGGFFTYLLSGQVSFVDLGYHLRAGDWLFETGRILDRDVFTSTFYGADWLNQNWMAQAILTAVGRIGGLEGLVVLNVLLFTAGFAVLLRICLRRSGEARTAAAACVVAVLPAVYNTNVRPQSFSWLLMAVVLLTLEWTQARPRLALLLVPVFALWANIHGAFAIGLAFVAIDAALALWDLRKGSAHRERAAYLASATVLSGLAVMINPWGWRVYVYVLDIGSDSTIRRAIEEWQPPNITSTAGALFFVSVAAVAVAIFLGRGRPSIRDSLRLCLGGALGMIAIRNGLWWAMAAGPALASALAPAGRRFLSRPDEPKRIHLAVVAAVAALAVLSSPWMRSVSPLLPEANRPLVARGTPVGAASFLSDHGFSGNMLNTQAYGSFLELMTPNHRVFIDSRIEMYPSGLWADYVTMMTAAPGWRRLMERYDVGYVVIAARPRPELLEALRRSEAWRSVYSDDVAAIFVREGS